MAAARKNPLSLKFAAILLLLAASYCPAAETVLMDEQFSAPADTWKGGEIETESGQLRLTVGGQTCYAGQLFMTNPVLHLPTDPDGQLKISLTVAGFSEAGGRPDFPCTLRAFVMAEPLAKFIEPYNADQGFCLMLEYHNATEPTSISFFQKSLGQKGYGQLLYSGRIATAELPVRIDLCLNREIYRLNFSKEVDTNQGARSGRQQLGATPFGQADLRFGARLVNHADGGQSVVHFAALRMVQTTPE